MSAEKLNTVEHSLTVNQNKKICRNLREGGKVLQLIMQQHHSLMFMLLTQQYF